MSLMFVLDDVNIFKDGDINCFHMRRKL